VAASSVILTTTMPALSDVGTGKASMTESSEHSSSSFGFPLDESSLSLTGVLGGESHLGDSYRIIVPNKRETNDLSDLTIDKLNFDNVAVHGREEEVSLLQGRLQEIANKVKHRQLVFISGTSGVGKSKLAETLRRPVHKQKGLFVCGKYDSKIKMEPYSGISRAFSEICGSLLHRQENNEAVVKTVLKEIADSLGSELPLLCNVIPALTELLDVDDQSPDYSSAKGVKSTSSANDTQQALNFAFLRFIRIVTQRCGPLVMVLDDLQWSDASSFDLLEAMLSDHLSGNLMVIGTFRSNEVEPSSRLHSFLGDWKPKAEKMNFLWIVSTLLT
jgi:predicted ATPase